jgi:hypothetical protein
MVSLLIIKKSLHTHQNIGVSEEKVKSGENATCEDDTHESLDQEDQDETCVGDGDDDQPEEPQLVRDKVIVDEGVESELGLVHDKVIVDEGVESELGGGSMKYGGRYNDSNSSFMHDNMHGTTTTSAMHGTTTTSAMHDATMPDISNTMYGATDMHGTATTMHDFTWNFYPTATLHAGDSSGIATLPPNHGSYSVATDFDPFNTNPAFWPTDWTTRPFDTSEWMSGLLPEGGFLSNEYGTSLPLLPAFPGPNLASPSGIEGQGTQGSPSVPPTTDGSTTNVLPSPCSLQTTDSLPTAAAAKVLHGPTAITKTGPNTGSADSDVAGASAPSHSEQRKSARAPKPSTRNSTANAIGRNPGKENALVPPAKNTEVITTQSRKRGAEVHLDAVNAKYV